MFTVTMKRPFERKLYFCIDFSNYSAQLDSNPDRVRKYADRESATRAAELAKMLFSGEKEIRVESVAE